MTSNITNPTNNLKGPFSTTNLAKLREAFLKATITLFTISAALAIFAILFSHDEGTFRILGTTSLLSVFSMLSLNNTLRLGSEYKVTRIAAACAIIADIVWIIPQLCLLWGLMPSYSDSYGFNVTIMKITYTGLIVAITSTIVSSFSNYYYRTQESSIKLLACLTIISAVILSVVILFVLWPETFIGELWQLYVILGIFLIFGLITTPILVRIKQGGAHKDAQPVNQDELRAQIEREVRAKIAAEQSAHLIKEPDSPTPTEEPKHTPPAQSQSANPATEQSAPQPSNATVNEQD